MRIRGFGNVLGVIRDRGEVKYILVFLRMGW